MIVFLEQRGNTIALFLRVERARGKILDMNLFRIHRPQRGRDVTLIVQPRSHPAQITMRHKLARHLRMRGRERLKHMKQPSIANGPGYEHETESYRKDRGMKCRFTKLSKTSKCRQHQREPDRRG